MRRPFERKKLRKDVGAGGSLRRWLAGEKKVRVRRKLPTKGSGTDTWSSCHGRMLAKKRATNRRRRKLATIQKQRTRRMR